MIISWIAVCLLLTGQASWVQAKQAQEPATASIVLNGTKLEMLPGVTIPIVSGSVMIPIRMVVQGLGYEVKWQQKEQKVTVLALDKKIEMTVRNEEAFVNGLAKRMTAAPMVISGTSYIPLRFVGEELGLKVGWDNKSKTVSLDSAMPAAPQQEPLPPVAAAPEGPGLPGGTNSGGTTDAAPVPAPVTDAGQMKVETISYADNRLIVSTSEPVEPKFSTMSGPDRIIMDIPNAVFSTSLSQSLVTGGQGSIAVNDAYVKKIRYSLFSKEPQSIRIVIDTTQAIPYEVIKEEAGAYYVIIDLNAGIANTPVQPIGQDGKKLVVIDPGHGGSDPGAASVTGRREKDFTLSLSHKVVQLLSAEPGIDVVMTRSDDTYVELGSRGTMANALGANIFLSIHGNSFPQNPSVRGTETYYYNEACRPFAELMHRHLLGASGFPDRKVKSKSLKVLRDAAMDALLLEIGFLSNSEEELIMFDESFQWRVAQAIVDGIKEQLQVQGQVKQQVQGQLPVPQTGV
ncbi:N-acetylmuramoyl-L-alanine amidase family protein [Paenibacillus sambharensis]|uniref:N-acetylmuramoyl-L-alanine amidase family protein n=1 Tax=Paenibacillus sambharensis TaxID=1803190 RepID=UPI0015E8DD3D|nr:N-acetylmuramoyl-L-alanine amidase family protein [Paenibacillus sambharensis]